jgi:enhancing lycopene biosynthesis protein 2
MKQPNKKHKSKRARFGGDHMKKVAAVLSGFGVFNSAEIHKSVLTLVNEPKNQMLYQCLSPDTELMRVVITLS